MANNNLPSITIEGFTKIVEMQFEEKNFRPIFGLGKGGIGKTESIMDLAKNKLKIGYIDIRLLLYSETDLKGIPYPNAEHTATIWLQNNILPKEGDETEGIIVFDEITSCAKSVRTAAYQLLNERKLGEYKLPDGWMIVCLGNGEDDGGDYQGMEGNFANRCSVFNVVPDVDAWKSWAVNHDINMMVLGYINWRPMDLHTYSPDSETEILFASPRSWTAVSDILNKHPYEDDNILHSRIQANLGLTIGQQFIQFCKLKDDKVNPYDIVNNGANPNIERAEVLHMTIASVVKITGDLIINDFQQFGEKHSSETIRKTANALRWIFSLKKECAVMGFNDLISHDKNKVRSLMVSPDFLHECPEFMKFATDNKEIFK